MPIFGFKNIEFNPEFEHAHKLMEDSDHHLFITGRAGTGKSTLLGYFRENTRKNIVVLAPTGIAAINVKGQTIHSFFGFPPHPIHSDDIKKRRNRELYMNLDAIVIDEVSMVRADMLDAINHFMRINGRRRDKPFGGVQMIFIGDLFQLPPVISSAVEKQLFAFLYDTPFFFSASVLYGVHIKYIELKKVYRQKDIQFLSLLDMVRTKQIDDANMRRINQRCQRYFKPPEDDPYITLTSTNRIAHRINSEKLGKLPGVPFGFEAEVEGKFEARSFPADETLILKAGAQVMFVRNDPHFRWVNGTIGAIQYVDEGIVTVKVVTEKDEVVHKVEKETWEILKYQYDEKTQKISTEILGTFIQYPLKLAWAITIHKSQGKTFDKVIIDLGRGAFAPGQVYVALSRCTSLEGIVLRQNIGHKDIMVDERILAFAQRTGVYDV